MPYVKENFGELGRNWGWVLALGIVLVVAGVIGLGMTATLGLVSMLYFGFLMLLAAAFQLVAFVRSKGWRDGFWGLLIAVLYLAAGLIMVFDPLLASATLTLLIGSSLIAIGVLRVLMALSLRGTYGWGWTLIGGLLVLALGGVVVSGWPVSGLLFIGLIIAIEIILSGFSYIAVALAARDAHRSW
ncbi:MAG: DUF308 domain-containing protein [Oceanospirillaceae bacterium]|nr:DUF308 domain-containing protein [Oceanospirillaceae bacterium]